VKGGTCRPPDPAARQAPANVNLTKPTLESLLAHLQCQHFEIWRKFLRATGPNSEREWVVPEKCFSGTTERVIILDNHVVARDNLWPSWLPQLRVFDSPPTLPGNRCAPNLVH